MPVLTKVYSRTGIGRIGNQSAFYSTVNRCFTNNPSTDVHDKGIAKTPARYGLFIARKIKYDDQRQQITGMKMFTDKTGDDKYISNHDHLEDLQPIRKLFAGDLLINSAQIHFSETHKSTKISAMLGSAYEINSVTLVQTNRVNSSFLSFLLRGNLSSR